MWIVKRRVSLIHTEKALEEALGEKQLEDIQKSQLTIVV